MVKEKTNPLSTLCLLAGEQQILCIVQSTVKCCWLVKRVELTLINTYTYNPWISWPYSLDTVFTLELARIFGKGSTHSNGKHDACTAKLHVLGFSGGSKVIGADV